MSKKLVLSISGGMDSVVLLHMAVDRGYDEINLISYDYGQRHIRELSCIKDQIKAVKVKNNSKSKLYNSKEIFKSRYLYYRRVWVTD